MNHSIRATWILSACAALTLSACGGAAAPDAAIGGSVSGLAAGSAVTLQDNNATVLSVAGSSAFEFPDTMAPNAAYAVSVATQPPGATCSVANGSGTVDSNGDPVTNVLVSCSPGTTVGGTVAGLIAGTNVSLTDGTNALTVAGNGAFSFGDLYANGAAFTVSVASQPASQVCSVSNGSGSVDGQGDAVVNIAVICTASPPLSGTVVGLTPGATVTLSDGTSNVQVAANSSFVFADSSAPGASMQVNVVNQPQGQTCVSNSSTQGFDANGNPTLNVAVNCTTNGTVGGTVQGLASNATLTLTDGNSTLALTAGGSFAFTDLYAPGAAYAVSVAQQPNGQNCTVQGGGGTFDANDDAVSTVMVTCS